jgi:hypothetical protein
MPSYIVKPDRDVDFYVMWSDVVEAPTTWGARKDFKAAQWMRPEEIAPERFERADAMGTSAMWGDPADPYLGWNDALGPIYMQRGFLPRANLRALCERLKADENDRVTDLLVPFDGDDEVRP